MNSKTMRNLSHADGRRKRTFQKGGKSEKSAGHLHPGWNVSNVQLLSLSHFSSSCFGCDHTWAWEWMQSLFSYDPQLPVSKSVHLLIDPTRWARCKITALPGASHLASDCKLGWEVEEGRGRLLDPFDKQGWVEGTRFIWLFQWFQSRQRVTRLPYCTETFFVCSQLWEVNKVVYPVFDKRVRCTAWQPHCCF